MRTVVFKEEFFDGSRRYRSGVEHSVPDDLVLPKFDIASIDGKPYDRPARDYKATPQRKTRSQSED